MIPIRFQVVSNVMKGVHVFTIYQIQVVGNVFVALGSLPFLTELR